MGELIMDKIVILRTEGPNVYYNYITDNAERISMEFDHASEFKYGWGIVKNDDVDAYFFIDQDFILESKGYKEINKDYDFEGYWCVRETKDGPWKYRDCLGVVSECINDRDPETLGMVNQYLAYIDETISVFDLSEDCFGNKYFLREIRDKEPKKLERDLLLCETAEEVMQVKEMAKLVDGYVEAMVLEQSSKQEEARRIKTEKEKEKQEAEEVIKGMF